MEKIKKILVTGNLGYIGSILTPFLFREGYEVVGLDSGLFEGEDFVPREKGTISQIKKDIRDIELNDLEGVDAVIHLAALAFLVPASKEKSGTDLMMDINFKSSLRLAKLSKEARIKKFLFASTCSVYGKADGDNLVTETSKLNPNSTYAISKIEAEKAISKLADENFCPVFLRNATCYGISPRMRFDLVVNNLMGSAYTTGEIKIFSDGTPWRPIVHIEDVARAFIAALKAPCPVIFNQAFNVGQDLENYMVKDIADIIAKNLPHAKVNCLNITGPDKRSYKVGFNKIKKLIGFQPKWNMKNYIPIIYEKMMDINFSYDDFMSYKYDSYEFCEHLIKSKRTREDLRWI